MLEVVINYDKPVNGFATRDITDINVDEYSEIIVCLKYRLEYLEEKIEDYTQSEDERLKRFIPKKENEIERLTKIIEILQ